MPPDRAHGTHVHVSGQLYVRVTPAEHEAVREAATRCGMSLHAWHRMVLLVASGYSEAGLHLARLKGLPKP